jgi:hypothetical protein
VAGGAAWVRAGIVLAGRVAVAVGAERRTGAAERRERCESGSQNERKEVSSCYSSQNRADKYCNPSTQ